MTEDEAIARSIHAQQILDDPLVVEAFAGLEARWIPVLRERLVRPGACADTNRSAHHSES